MGEFIDKAKGKGKQAVGEVTGNERLKAEGRIQEAIGRLKGAFETAKVSLRDALRNYRATRTS